MCTNHKNCKMDLEFKTKYLPIVMTKISQIPTEKEIRNVILSIENEINENSHQLSDI